MVATSLERGLPVGFVESAAPPPRSDREIHYVHTRLEGQHVRASAAIPLLFPPVEVTAPLGAAGHYVDGATRLNAPIAPALALGAERVIVVGYEPLAASSARPPAKGVLPRLADVAANALDGLLLDQVAHDVRRMLAVNAFFAESPTTGTSRAARAYREAHGRPPYRRISYALVAPSRRGEIGALAEAVFQERYGGLRGLRSPDFALLARLLGGGRAQSRGELLSFVLFDEVFIERLLQAGPRRRAALAERAPGLLVLRRGRRGLRGAGRVGRDRRARRVPRAQEALGPRSTETPEWPGSPSPGSSERSKYWNAFGSTGSGSRSVAVAVRADAERPEADEPLVGAEQPQLVELAAAGRRRPLTRDR